MKVKTSQSYFPTRVRPLTPGSYSSNNTRTYQLMKKQVSVGNSPVNVDKKTLLKNIFRSQVLQKKGIDARLERPVGGIDAFMKEHSKKRGEQNRRYNNQMMENQSSNFHRKECENEKQEFKGKQKHFLNSHTEEVDKKQEEEETFKQQHDYQSRSISKMSCTKTKTRPWTSTTKTFKSQKLENWVENQNQHYQTKMAYVNEVYYKKPLVQRYGDRYFQYFLRNRYEEDLPPPCYIHQLHGGQGEKKRIRDDKFLSKLRKINPGIKNYQKMTLKGRKVQAAN